jgi:demethylmenaquinone methyltransferase/2-methoxy-6-polyprenyl-1,4-benzoquinol methylase
MEEEMKRVLRTKEEARRSYDRKAWWYDMAASFERYYTDIGLQLLSPRVGETILEIGFGTGGSLVELAQAVGRSGTVHGIDISPNMVAAARKKLNRAGVGDRVTLICGDATHLPYSERYFDGIFMSFSLELFDTPEILPLLHESRRVLRPRGRLCTVSLSRIEVNTAVKLYEFLHTIFPKSLDCRPIYSENLLREAGFDIDEKRVFSMYGLPIEIVAATSYDGE